MANNGEIFKRKVWHGENPTEEKPHPAQYQMAGAKWQEFVDNTTLHGIRYVFLKRSIVLRLLWLILLLTSGGYYISTVYRAINKFYDRPINTVMSKTHEKEMDFPAVTICPLNFFALSKLLMTDDDPSFASSGLNISSCAVTADVRGNKPCGMSLLCCCPEDEDSDISTFWPNCTTHYKQELIDVLRQLNYVPDKESFFRYYSQNMTDILGPICEFGWQEEKCSAEDFHASVTPWGMCYTFNSAEEEDRWTVDSGGAASGLTVLLDVQLPEHTLGKYSEGFKVLVHRQGEYVDEWEGINVAPGQHAVVAVTQKRFINLEYPFATNCSRKKLKSHNVYTLEGCIYECEAESIIKICGCRPTGYEGAPEVIVCVTEKDINCSNGAIAVTDETACGCEVPCNEVKYIPEVSYAKFPDKATTFDLLLSGRYSNESYIRENLLLLQVGFKSLSYETFEQKPAYDSNSLFGEIGGNMGLFLGCSLLTICEFVDFFIGLLATRRRLAPQPAS